MLVSYASSQLITIATENLPFHGRPLGDSWCCWHGFKTTKAVEQFQICWSLLVVSDIRPSPRITAMATNCAKMYQWGDALDCFLLTVPGFKLMTHRASHRRVFCYHLEMVR